MDSTAVVAALGLASTLIAGWFAASWQRRANREDRILEAKVRVYGECATALYDYERATYNRARTRLEEPAGERTPSRDEAYRASTVVKARIGQIALLSGGEGLMREFQGAHESVHAMTQAHSGADLKVRQAEATERIEDVLKLARVDLAHVK